MNTHYVCKGPCGAESSLPNVCTSDTCSRNGKPLVECKCIDGKHAEVLGKASDATVTEAHPEPEMNDTKNSSDGGPLEFNN